MGDEANPQTHSPHVNPSGTRPRSHAAFHQALQVIPGGVNSPVRAYGSVGGQPPFITRGAGGHIWDVDGNEYIDHVCSWGPLILGHVDPDVRAAVEAALHNGFSFGAPTEQETVLARLIVDAVPSIEKIRLVSSGTEATMSAIRLARGYTQRDTVVKFEGCYHGHVDALLVDAGSGAATLGRPSSAGIPQDFVEHTAVLPYNDVDALESLFETRGENIACVIVEPVAGNMGVIPPTDGFLQRLRSLTHEYSSLLVFDEVITGFRLARGGAQERFGIRPDLTTLGKTIGGGFPVGAYGGTAEIMDHVAPDGEVYQAGTLSGNPIAVTAGLATLKKLFETDGYSRLESLAERLATGLKKAAEHSGVATTHARVGSMLCMFFSSGPVNNFADASRSDTGRFERYHQGMLKRGIYLAPSQFEATFVSTAHTEEDIDRTIQAAEESLKEIR